MSTPRELFLPPILLDPASGVALHQQIRAQMAQGIRSGAPRGARLPSTRALAALLRVSRNTVLTAYDELAADGLIQGRRGASMTVAGMASAGVPLNANRIIADAQFPVHTIGVLDPDGTALYLSY